MKKLMLFGLGMGIGVAAVVIYDIATQPVDLEPLLNEIKDLIEKSDKITKEILSRP